MDVVCQEHSVLLIVGRGSGDEAATEEMIQFTKMRQLHHPRLKTQVSFVAMAAPSFDEKISKVCGTVEIREVIVQPHLLFQGILLDEIRRKVRVANCEVQRWRMTEHLGPAGSIADLLVQQFVQIQSRKAFPSICEG